MGKQPYSTAALQNLRKTANSQACFSPPPTSTLRVMTSLAMRLGRGLKLLSWQVSVPSELHLQPQAANFQRYNS
ncbi:unnamed protein product [Cuscuta campestris]|uniref:Uncharacterized protein n=1 Tax=Cuscuta campestris TaxID=132261 RepID=A0A484M655_9ASTE|nr:unnamed protein product [Cuscuta campestris]